MSETESASEEYAHTKQECLEAEAWLSNESPDNVEAEVVDHGTNVDIKYTCPICEREWEYVYSLNGLWNPREQRYEWEE